MRVFSFEQPAGRIEYILIFALTSLILWQMTSMPKEFTISYFKPIVFFGSLAVFFSCLAANVAVVCRRFTEIAADENFLALWLGANVGGVLFANIPTLVPVSYICYAYVTIFHLTLAVYPGGMRK